MKRPLVFLMLALLIAGRAHAATDWKGVDQALGRTAAVQPGDVHRYSFPRSDLSVTLDGVRIKPEIGRAHV